MTKPKTHGWGIALLATVVSACGGAVAATGSQDGGAVDASDSSVGARDSSVDVPESSVVAEADAVDAALDTTSTESPDTTEPAWTPLQLPGLALWLDGSHGLSYADAGTGIVWLDRSGMNNDATSVGSPTIAPNAIGGKAAVALDGTSDYFVIPDAPSLEFSTDDFLFAVVTAYTTATSGYGLVYSKQDPSDWPYIGPALVGNTQVVHSGGLQAQVADETSSWVLTSETDFNDGTPFCVTVHRFGLGGSNGAELLVRVNGSDSASESGPAYAIDVSAVGFPLHIGGTPAQQDVLGYIAEVVAARGPTATGDVNSLEAYLKAKYGL